MRYRSLLAAISAACVGFVAILLSSGVTPDVFAGPPSPKSRQITATQDEAADHLALATAAFKNNNYEEADKQLQRTLEGSSALSPDEIATAALMLAKVRWERGNPDSAFEWAELSLKHADTADAHYFLASVYEKQGKLSSANSQIDLAILDDPASATAYEFKAIIAVTRNDLDAAIAAYQKALFYANPSDPGYGRLQDRFDAVKEFAAQRFETAHPGYTPPSPINRPRPEYSEEARHKKIQGIVLVMFQVNEQGTVEDIRVVNGPGYGLDERAAKAVSQLHFSPAMRDGVAVKARVRVDVEFNLR
jgi:TonB family protein